jgi:hypothetical protein
MKISKKALELLEAKSTNPSKNRGPRTAALANTAPTSLKKKKS